MSSFNWENPKAESYQEFVARLSPAERRVMLQQELDKHLKKGLSIVERIKETEQEIINDPNSDSKGNFVASEGCDRCWCGNKYWAFDRCSDCDEPHWYFGKSPNFSKRK